MHPDMSARTRKEVLQRLRKNYRRAKGWQKTALLDEAMRVLGYHRKAAIRALRGVAAAPGPARTLALVGRPREYDAAQLLPALKEIWLTAQQPCGRRLAAALQDWVPAYEAYHRELEIDVRTALLRVSPATLDRLLQPLRVQYRAGKGGTRPGSLLRQQIPITGTVWEQAEAGYLEVDTVALCGGSLEGDHVWMLDGTDYATAWVEVRAQWNRGQHATLHGLEDIRRTLPFVLRGLDADNGGEFLNWHVIEWCREGPRRIALTRSRPYHKNDNAHVEQKNWTHVRQWFGYDRYDNEEVVELINALTRGALGQLQNLFQPTLKLKEKKRDEAGRLHRVYEAARTPYDRVLESAQVSGEKKQELRTLKAKLNPFALQKEIERQLKRIAAKRGARSRKK
jgi:hypothetical protein